MLLPGEHVAVLQAIVFIQAPMHFFPPFVASFNINLFETLVPPPQSAEQLLQRLNSDHLQSTGPIKIHIYKIVYNTF